LITKTALGQRISVQKADIESCEGTESPLWIISSATVLWLCMIVLLNSGTNR
jgi:hypothetical protein